MATYYSQPCPTCGRTLHVRVQYLGRDLQCQHCSGRFLAYDPTGEAPRPDSRLDVLARAERLLERRIPTFGLATTAKQTAVE